MKTYLGIEFGSTRIKAVQIGEDYAPVASSSYTWRSSFENGVWTYDLSEAFRGIKDVLSALPDTSHITAVGISGMMHGYLAFDKDWNLLVPFRTWQNTITAEAAEKLSALFDFNVPQRWSISHLYQAILNGEAHVAEVAHITTLAGYMHYMLTGVNAIGIGEASGVFPIGEDMDYDNEMLRKFDQLVSECGYSWRIKDVLPAVLCAGEEAGSLTEAGASLINGLLPTGLPFAPPEGDAGTGMVATNAVTERTGNVSAGTSIFSMVVLEKPFGKACQEIDIVTTPTGKPVAMVHCNNCTNDSNAWVSLLRETAELFGADPDDGEVYEKLYRKSLEAEDDCGGVMVCNYMAGEGITHLDAGVPLVLRTAQSRFNLANFFRATLYSTMVTLKMGMDILFAEDVKIDSLVGHGGLFKTAGVGQKYMAAACGAPVVCMETAGEGGAYGMALLAAFLFKKDETLESFLSNSVFKSVKSTIAYPEKNIGDGFAKYMEAYEKMLKVEEKAVEVM